MKLTTVLNYKFSEEEKNQIKHEAIKHTIKNRRGVEVLLSVIYCILFLSLIATLLIGVFLKEELFLIIAFCSIGFVLFITTDHLRRTIMGKQEQIIDLKDEIARLKTKEEIGDENSNSNI